MRNRLDIDLKEAMAGGLCSGAGGDHSGSFWSVTIDTLSNSNDMCAFTTHKFPRTYLRPPISVHLRDHSDHLGSPFPDPNVR